MRRCADGPARPPGEGWGVSLAPGRHVVRAPLCALYFVAAGFRDKQAFSRSGSLSFPVSPRVHRVTHTRSDDLESGHLVVISRKLASPI